VLSGDAVEGRTHVCICGQTLDTGISNWEKMSKRQGKERTRRVTIAPIHEREKEQKSQPRNEMPIEFPQEFLLVDSILALFYRANWTLFPELCLIFLLGHCWREKREESRGAS